MHIVTMVLVLLLAVVVSAFATRLLPVKIPAPLLQIPLGALLAGAFGVSITFDPHLFLLLFIPPLLFLDGWRIPKGAFFREWRPILTLATGLVVFTVVGLGWFVHWLIPTLPLAVAFALAAIVSPTDPVAVSAMTATAPLPSRLMHILEGESLLNDATGLVCFSFAVTAALTGSFSLPAASLSFVMVAGGGVLTGLAVVWAIARFNRLLVRRAGEDPAIQVLISLLIPFAAYLSAEHLGVSGILAAAVAGIGMHYGELLGRAPASTRMQRNVVWDTVQTALNGSIFVLLGAQLPSMLRRLPEVARAAGVGTAWHLLGYALLITLVLVVLRFVWVWLSMRITVFGAGRQRGDLADSAAIPAMPRMRVVAVTATAGVRGAITLAGILTLPLALADGTPFPGRELAIFLAMGVILLSLLVASVALPALARGLDADLPPAKRARPDHHARNAAAEAAVRRIEALLAQPLADPHEQAVRADAAMRVLEAYRHRLDYGEASAEHATELRRQAEAERMLRLEGLQAERDALFRLRLSRSIGDTAHQELLREIDLRELPLAGQSPR
ncbi:Na+/H+ antiporter [Massilia sp. DWR3-1-1]|uniref:Na+/H+ antiporter n=1 Tax=Massilia sp. DWR3-1-1 TaxID=2804559 RepID=UPI003CF1774E